MEPLLLTMQQASMMLGISRTKLYQLVQRGEIESVHIGRARRVPRSVLLRVRRTRASRIPIHGSAEAERWYGQEWPKRTTVMR